MENQYKPPQKKPQIVKTFQESVNEFKIFEFNSSRIRSLLSKTEFRKFCRFTVPANQKITNCPILVFFEHLGEQKEIFLDFFNNIKNVYPTSDIYVVIDDTYEGLLTDTDINFLVKNIEVRDWIVLTSNYKINHPKVLHLNIHLHDLYFDHINIRSVNFSPNTNLRKKKFICLNRQERLHRVLIVDYLLEEQLINDTFLSCQDIELKYVLLDKNPVKEKIDHHLTLDDYFEFRRYGGLKELREYDFSEKQKKRLLDNLPFFLEGESYANIDPKDLAPVDNFFNEAYWALVTERDFFRSNLYQGFTEKTVKCLLYGVPFIIIGLPFTLQKLRELGFVTFSDFIDESYDTEEDDNKRLEKIKKQISYLANLNYNEIHLMREKMMPILQYNFEHFKRIHYSLPNAEFLSLIQIWLQQSRQE
jgi:hypothetical protein